MAFDWLDRSLPLFGEDFLNKIHNKTVAVVGLGGVGGTCCEALCRFGIGRLILLDYDKIQETNRNRQLFATKSTVGLSKCDAAIHRLNEITDDTEFVSLNIFYSEDTSDILFSHSPDIIIDAIDCVSSKIHLIATAKEKNIPILSCLGTGNRLDPSKFRIGKLEETAGCGCGLARVIRRECKKRNISPTLVLYSTEQPIKIAIDEKDGKRPPASSPSCPPVAGYILAAEAVKLFENNNY